MRKQSKEMLWRAIVSVAIVTGGGVSFADQIVVGADITAYDSWRDNASAWYGGGENNPTDTRTNSASAMLVDGTAPGVTVPTTNTGGWVREDQETEPGTVNGQGWDLEGVYLSSGWTNKPVLSLVGGYDFVNGITYASPGYGYDTLWTSGDVFLDVDTSLVADNPLPPNTDGSGYDYVIVFSRNSNGTLLGSTSAGVFTGSYSVYAIPGSGALSNIQTVEIEQTSPYRYLPASGETTVGSGTFTVASFTQTQFDSDFAPSYTPIGGTHYVMSGLVLDFLGTEWDGTGDTIYTHYTMECGNDNLVGYAERVNFSPPVPEPATLSILSMALLGLGLKARKHLKG